MDIQVETEEGKVLGLGEVKGEGEGRYQVLAAMQAYRERTGTWPVVGFVADSETLQLMEPQERGGTHVTVQHTRFTTAKFDHLMSFVEQLVAALSVDIEPSWQGWISWRRPLKTTGPWWAGACRILNNTSRPLKTTGPWWAGACKILKNPSRTWRG